MHNETVHQMSFDRWKLTFTLPIQSAGWDGSLLWAVAELAFGAAAGQRWNAGVVGDVLDWVGSKNEKKFQKNFKIERASLLTVGLPKSIHFHCPACAASTIQRQMQSDSARFVASTRGADRARDSFAECIRVAPSPPPKWPSFAPRPGSASRCRATSYRRCACDAPHLSVRGTFEWPEPAPSAPPASSVAPHSVSLSTALFVLRVPSVSVSDLRAWDERDQSRKRFKSSHYRNWLSHDTRD